MVLIGMFRDQLLGTRYGFLGNPFDTGDDFDDARNRIYVRSYLEEGDFEHLQDRSSTDQYQRELSLRTG